MRADWITSFVEYTDTTTSPELFRKWAAISAIAGALERKVWVRTMGSPTFPNMYVVLVAPPGVGKSEATWRVEALWHELEDHHVAATSVTKASLIDELAEANRRVITNDPAEPVVSFNSLLLCINELGVLLPAYENEFMSVLTDMWDCKRYSEKRRTRKVEVEIERTQLNLLAACTPAYLMNVLPEGAWDQGFLSRTMLIYSGESQLRSLFDEPEYNDRLWEELKIGLKSIGNLYGMMRFHPEAAAKVDKFYLSNGAPTPDHPKLINYNSRRTRHLIKLCMIMSMSRDDELTIMPEDYDRAYDTLTEAEAYMPEIFKAMAQGGAGDVMQEAWYYIFKTYSKENKPVYKYRIIQYLQERVPVHSIEPMINMMEQGNMIEKRLSSSGTAYIPKGRKALT